MERIIALLMWLSIWWAWILIAVVQLSWETKYLWVNIMVVGVVGILVSTYLCIVL